MNDEKRYMIDEEVEDRPVERERPSKKAKLVPMRVDNCSRVNIRTEPSMESDVLKTVDRGVIVYSDPSFRDEAFVSVKLDGNITGFIKKDFLTAI